MASSPVGIGSSRWGRPATYSIEVMHEFCDRISNGELICEVSKDPGMPSRGTIWRWCEEHPEIRALYARSRAMQAEAIAERAVMDGRAATSIDANAARVRMDANKWMAARLDPRRWSERQQLQQMDEEDAVTNGPSRIVIELVGDAPEETKNLLTGGANGRKVSTPVEYVGD